MLNEIFQKDLKTDLQEILHLEPVIKSMTKPHRLAYVSLVPFP